MITASTEVFARQVRGLARPGDVLVGISTSGNSANIVAAFETAREMGVGTVALTGGGGGKMATLADLLINAPSLSTPRIQELHIAIGHTICELVEDALPVSGGGAEAMQAVILVGGRGTRLGAVTDHCPKPLVDVGGRPFLDYIIANLARHGFTDIVLLAGYLAEQLKALEARAPELGCRIRCLVEPSPGRDSGRIAARAGHLAEQFLLLNGDSLFDINYLDLCVPADLLAGARSGRWRCGAWPIRAAMAASS